MTGKEVTAADLAGALGGVVAAGGKHGSQIAVVTLAATSAAYDLQSSDYFNGQAYQSGNFVELDCATTVYYFWSDTDTDVVDEAAADGVDRGKQCARLLANVPRQEKPRGRYLIAKAATGTPLLRVILRNTVPVE